MNVGENRARNGVTDCPESRNEVSVEKRKKLPLGASNHENSSSNLSNLNSEAAGTFRSHPGTFIRVQIIFLPAEIRQKRLNSIMELKVLILELYLVNPYNEALRYVPTGNILRTELDVRKELDTAMDDQGERYIYQRFPYVVLDDTPSDSSGADSDPDEALSVASQATPAAPRTPSAPRPVTPPPPAPVHEPAPMPSPPRAPAWDGLRRMRGQARKTTGLPPRHQMAQRDEPSTVHEVGESSRQAELRGQVQQVAQDLQGLRQEVHQHHTLLEDTRNILLEILTSHLTLMEQVNLMGIDNQAWRITVEKRFSRTLRQRIVAAFWQQVEVMRAGLVRVREFLVWLETVSFETRMIVLAVTMAAVAIIFSCLSYFIR
ncbi:hypothetical protein E3N88_31655 [Mikania micrantha]|uniref:Uncharacterized protein n=1 Tax=Mikania micrantha TaxID=192012 RepID=A0A5N6M6U3_9ASTR|nr:hypothetical protein E3N88_31655 [Mikania micrantha]